MKNDSRTEAKHLYETILGLCESGDENYGEELVQ